MGLVQQEDKILLYIIMSKILAILAIVGAAIGASQMFNNSSPQIKAPEPAPAPYGGGKRRTKKNRKTKKK